MGHGSNYGSSGSIQNIHSKLIFQTCKLIPGTGIFAAFQSVQFLSVVYSDQLSIIF